jgi:hypothetical protein
LGPADARALRSIIRKFAVAKLNAGGTAASDRVHLGEIAYCFAPQRENSKMGGGRVTVAGREVTPI